MRARPRHAVSASASVVLLRAISQASATNDSPHSMLFGLATKLLLARRYCRRRSPCGSRRSHRHHRCVSFLPASAAATGSAVAPAAGRQWRRAARGRWLWL